MNDRPEMSASASSAERAPYGDMTASQSRGPSRADGLADDAEMEAVVVRRVTRRIVPLLFALYVACFLDRTNVSFAALQMNRDLGLGPAVYGLGAGIFFLAYALFEVPANLALVRFGARRWLGRIAITWGLLAAAMMFVRGAGSFYVMRFLLGIAEAGALPGIVYYMTQWFPERQRARALSRFMVSIPVAGALGGALGGALLALDGRLGLAGWQWLFLVEGVPAVLLGVAALVWLPDGPGDARWLPETERRWLLRRLGEEAPRRGADRATLWAMFTDPVVWRLAFPYLAMSTSIYAVLFWQPTMLREIAHLADRTVALVVTLSGLAGAVAMVLVGLHSDRRGERVRHATVTLIVAAAGCAIGAATRQPIVVAVSIAVAASAGTAYLPVFWCVPPLMLGAGTAAAGIAFINSLGNIGGFVGPAAFGALRQASGGFVGALLAAAAIALVAALLTLSLRAVVGSERRRDAIR